MSNTLLPCPFCGGMNIRIWDKSRYDTCARCDDCDSQTGWLPTISDAIAAWNSRTGKDINVATNAQRIRSMSDEELAEFLSHHVCYSGMADKVFTLRWLRQPLKEEVI